MNLALKVENLSKSYTVREKEPGLRGAIKGLFVQKKKAVHALKGLSFEIKPGEGVGLIGENGAGKSTTMKLCTGILRPSQGQVEVLGHIPWKERRKLAMKIGVVFGQRPQLLWDIAVRESFELIRIMYRVPDKIYAQTYTLVEKHLEVGALLKTPVRQLSLGQRMRADLACALLHAPEIAFLDEPTIGLDVLAKEQARSLIKAMRRRFGLTLILTTHDLKDITDTCERVVLLDKGSKLFDGSLKAFDDTYAREKRLIADLEAPPAASAKAQLAREIKKFGAHIRGREGRRLVVAYERSSVVQGLVKAVLKRLKVADLTFEKTEIEAIVRNIYRSKGRGRRGA